VASFMTEQRTKEIGIRKILGASLPNILVLLSKNFTLLVGIAFSIAAPTAYLIMDRWWLQSFAYRLDLGVGPFVVAGTISLLIAWGTVGYHALKIARMNPVETLKYE
jgi:putative ABC transport system permease protein